MKELIPTLLGADVKVKRILPRQKKYFKILWNWARLVIYFVSKKERNKNNAQRFAVMFLQVVHPLELRSSWYDAVKKQVEHEDVRQLKKKELCRILVSSFYFVIHQGLTRLTE